MPVGDLPTESVRSFTQVIPHTEDCRPLEGSGTVVRGAWIHELYHGLSADYVHNTFHTCAKALFQKYADAVVIN